jgi:hypothetical protein
MNQTLHIFQKDARRLWAEIFLSLALVAGFVLTVPYKWAFLNNSSANYLGPSVMQLLAYGVELLVPVSWWLLIVRAIHSERLVGDRQFWITRPYEWKRLLAAKVLFLAVFLYLPFVAAQGIMIVVAGFSGTSLLRSVAYNLLLISGILILPLSAIATVTKNLVRMTLTLLGTLLVLWLLILFSSLTAANSIAAPIAGRISAILIVGTLSTAILVQYATRRAWRSRALLIATPVVLVAAQMIAPSQPDAALMNRTYPPIAGTGAPLHVSYNPQAVPPPSAFVPRQSNSVGIEIPIQISGIADGTIVDTDDVKVAIETADGSHWNSSWQPLFRQMRSYKDSIALADIVLPRKVYDEFKSAQLTVHLDLALKQMKTEKTTPMTNPANEYSVPNIGNCKLQVILSNPDPVTGVVRANNDLECRFGLYIPLTHVTTSWTYKPCLASQTDLGPAMPITYGDYWVGSDNASTLDLPLIPFQAQNYTFSNSLNGGPDKKFCPDTPSVTFTQYAPLRRMRAEVTIQGFHLPAPSEGQMRVIENP